MADSKNWRFGVAGNIVGRHTDTDGNVYYGTKAFTPGTKVYLDGKHWSIEQNTISVIGRNRFGKKVVESIDVNLIENVRIQRIFDPKILTILDYLEAIDGWAWWGKNSYDRKEVNLFVKNWNSRRIATESNLFPRCLKNDSTIELLSLFSYKDCDYNRCRELIKEIGSVTRIIASDDDFETTPLHAAIDHEHYDFALELINEPNANLDVKTDDQAPIIWDLQHLWFGTEKERFIESLKKQEILQAMIKNGANPNPVIDGESLLNYLRFKINEDDEDLCHLIQMEHTIDAHANGVTDYFLEKLQKNSVKSIFMSKYDFRYFDKSTILCDHVLVLFDDNEHFIVSSYESSTYKYALYAVKVPCESDTTEYDNYEKLITERPNIIFLKSINESELNCIEFDVDGAKLIISKDGLGVCINVTNKE